MGVPGAGRRKSRVVGATVDQSGMGIRPRGGVAGKWRRAGGKTLQGKDQQLLSAIGKEACGLRDRTTGVGGQSEVWE